MEKAVKNSEMSLDDNASISGKSGPSPPGKGEKSGKPAPNSSATSATAKDDDKIITIDLTDPEDLMRKMEMIDFTDEETDELMKQAMLVNKMLKRELEKNEFEALRKSFARAVTISATTGERTSGLMVLPPVENATHGSKTNLASLNFSKQTSISTPPSSSSGHAILAGRTRSSAGGSKKAASDKRKKSAAPKAEWNERWNGEYKKQT